MDCKHYICYSLHNKFEMKAKITGLGKYLPEHIITNQFLSSVMDTSNEWIIERTGIEERRYFEEGKDSVSNMAYKASMQALEMAGLKAEEVDLIVFATLSPDYNFPGSGVLLQRLLGLKNIPAIDIRQQCSGFIYGLSIAEQYIKTGTYKCVLVVGSEIQSNILELTDRSRNVAVIFGDGAGAAILQASDAKSSGILSSHIHADGEFAEELYLAHPGSNRKERITAEMIEKGEFLPYMNGQLVFKTAVVKFAEVIEEALSHNNLKKEDLNLLVPHQANLRISEFIRKKMGLAENQVMNNIQKYGNTTAASIPIALCEAWESGKIKEGDLICVAAFGSGFTWGSTLLRW